MRAVVQRVSEASVTINQTVKSEIGKGLLILIGIESVDTQEDIDWLVNKIINMRIFDDENSIMNLSILDIKGELLIVSQFTLFANIKKGNRPSYIRAAKSEFAIPFYEKFVKTIAFLSGLNTLTGEFGADMKVKLLNDGPVTILIDTKQRE